MRHVYQILIELSKIQILNFRQKVNNYKNKLTNNQSFSNYSLGV